MRSSCTCGAVHLGVWPAGVNAAAQYGASVKAMAVHLSQYHSVPLARTTALMQDLYGATLSQASIQSFAQEAAFTLRPTVGAITQAVQDSAAFEALGLLEGIKGVLVHDGLVSYKGLDCTHSLCNAHHISELVYIHEQENEKIWDPWAQQMIDLLLQVLLLKRLRKCRQDVWRFASEAGLPSTNNLAEQVLRVAKVKQKISGCFRTEQGADTFFKIRSCLAPMTKQKTNLFNGLANVFNHQTIQPNFAA